MAHPIIEALKQKPYNYNVEQPDPKDNDSYLLPLSSDLKLSIHMKKPNAVWSGVRDDERVLRDKFTSEEKKVMHKFIRDFNVVKMDISVPDTKYPVGENEPEPEPAPYTKSHSEPQGKAVKGETKQTRLITASVQPAASQGALSFNDEQIKAMMGTVAKGASEAEFTMLMHLSVKYGLDPFLHEIYYVPQMKTIMTSRDGYLKIAQRHPSFKGIHSMAVRENDDFEVDVANHTVHHKFGKGDRGKLIGAWAIVYREGRHPVIAYADLSEYKGNSMPWTKYTSAMICKCAESFALKRQFGISGLVTQEEMDYHEEGDPEIVNAEYVDINAIDADYCVIGEE